MKYKAENGNQDYDRIAINMWITDKKKSANMSVTLLIN